MMQVATEVVISPSMLRNWRRFSGRFLGSRFWSHLRSFVTTISRSSAGGWMYLSTILDDYSRYIIAWKLCSTMKAEDVIDTLELALIASGCDQAPVQHKPRLLSDNGSSYISGDLAEWLDDRRMKHVRGAPYHPQT